MDDTLISATTLSDSIKFPYTNLHKLVCSASLQEFQHLHRLNTNVYTAFKSDSTPPVSDATDTIHLSQNLFATAAIADTGEVSLTERDNKNDILTQGQILQAPDAPKIIECQKNEFSTLNEMDIMDIEPIALLPPCARLLCSIWSYRRKRLPNGVLSKYKARLCVNGKEQAFGRDYWEANAPVAAWSNIGLLLYLSTILNLHTRHVDYTSAFPQADLDVPVFMRVPQGWYINAESTLMQHSNPKYQDKAHYLKLKKNLYGCKQAARNWFKKLSKGLIKQGFIQFKTGTCLFLCDDCVIVIYVDDCLFFSPKATTIDYVIQNLSKTFKLKDEGDVSAFLGVQITKDPTKKTITFTQPGLISQIIKDVGITLSSKGKDTPSDSILHYGKDGPSRVENWNYRSILGKLNY
jgi:hypothetical protein